MIDQIKVLPKFYPAALTVAGSDSGGGAGVEADLRTFNAFGVYGCAAITAVTSQNPRRVTRIDPVPAAGVVAQIEAVLETTPVKWIKTGMLCNAEIVAAVAGAVRKHRLGLVCDPVMVSTSGAALLESPAVEAARRELLPLATWITPNLPEAELLLGRSLKSPEDYPDAARECYDRWGVDVLLKTGHDIRGRRAADIVCRSGRLYRLSSPRLELPPYAAHGTGCTLSAALAAALALGLDWKSALSDAKTFVQGSLRECVEIGRGVWAMYPPTEDDSALIRLEAIRKK